MPSSLQRHIRPGSEISRDLFEKMTELERDKAEGRLTNVEYVERLGLLASQEALEKVNRHAG